jgi:hypothetical protein
MSKVDLERAVLLQETIKRSIKVRKMRTDKPKRKKVTLRTFRTGKSG